LSLRRLFLAILSTCSASDVGKVTLLRTCFADAISPVYTVMVHLCRRPHGRFYYDREAPRPHWIRSGRALWPACGTCTFHPRFSTSGPHR
jgi:hypothetical protein